MPRASTHRVDHNYIRINAEIMLFSVGGAIDAPEMHQHAIDNMLKQLVLGGMPLEIANDILGSDDN